MFQSTKVYFLLSIMLTLITNLSYGAKSPYWGSIKSEGCTVGNTEKFGARLWGINGDWMQACLAKANFVKGFMYDHPHTCSKRSVFNGIWGEWYIKTDKCKSEWKNIKKIGCLSWPKGIMRYQASLSKKKFFKTVNAYTLPIQIDGHNLGGPLTYSNGKAEFHVTDASCLDIPTDKNTHTKAYHQLKNQTIANQINQLYSQTGEPVTRFEAWITNQDFITVDLGGEGYHEVHGLISGFTDAINLNAQANDSQLKTPIPNLVHLNNWSDSYPLADQFAEYIVMQGAPLTDHNVNEIVRMLRLGGKVGLWIDEDMFQEQISLLSQQLKCKPTFNAPDEFNGKAGFAKILIEDRRSSYDITLDMD